MPFRPFEKPFDLYRPFGGGGNSWMTIAQPDAAFAFLPFAIQKKGQEFRVAPAWDISAQVSRSGGEYYVSKSGNDTTGDGLSWATAWKTLTKAWTALAAVDYACVYVGAGRYGWNDGGLNNNAWVLSRSIVGVGDVVFDSYFFGSAWALTTDQTNTYQSNITVPIGLVLDFGALDANGDPASYALKTSIAEVEATPGTFWYDGGAPKMLYVHSLESNSPDTDVRPQYAGNSTVRIAVSNINAYVENIKNYRAGVTALNNSAENTGVVYLNNCRFIYREAASPLIQFGGYDAYLRSCQYSHIAQNTDLMSGDVLNTRICKVVEIDCIGWDCGTVAYTGSNVTTNHHAGTNVIVGGEYHDTYGPPVAFIGSGYCWLLGVNAHDNLASASNYYSYQLDEAGAWLDRCQSSGSTKDILATQPVFVRNFIGATSNDGTVTEY